MSDLVPGSASLIFEVREPELNGDALRLHYALRDGDAVITEYTEFIGLPAAVKPEADLGRLTHLLALAASLSYYKAFIAPTFEVAFALSPSERDFLTALILNGLSEFAYRNDVPSALRPTIAASEIVTPSPTQTPPETRRALVAVGGGKDSIVTLETIRAAGIEQTLFSVNDYLPIRRTAERANLPLLQAARRLDPVLFEQNKAGALNGHVPVTAINSLIACIVAVRGGFTDVVFSNEASASAGNTRWEGVEVNHQWSKGLTFETLLRDQLAGTGVEYFSMLRPFTELAIMRRFAQLTSFHDVFTSCNRAFHLDPQMRRSWCGDCPKCRFVFLMLAPFLERDALLAIFSGRDLLGDPAQREGFLALFNIDGRMKPFECVGEPAECLAALHLLAELPAWKDLDLLELDTMSDEAVAALFTPSTPHNIPPSYAEALDAIQ